MLAHYFEKHGIASVAISLIRLTAEKVAPPRSLWVPFDLGRPFGEPNNQEVQSRVIRHALSLVQKKEGPILELFPDSTTQKSKEQEQWSCPVSFHPEEKRSLLFFSEVSATEICSRTPAARSS